MISFLQMSLWSAVLIALICAVRAAFLEKIPKRIFRLMWGAVILRMLLPLSLPITKINADAALPERSAVITVDTAVYEYNGETVYAVSEAAPADKKPFPFTAVRLGTAALLFAIFAGVHLRFRLQIRDSLPVSNDCGQRYGLKRKLRVLVSDRIFSPLTYGIFRPVILLPKNIFSCGERNAEYALKHEIAHIKRFDALYKLLMTAAVCLHWFNPLAWVMLVLAERDLELACDEEVVSGGGSREDYALALIEMEEKRSFGALASGFGGSSVTERIKAVMTVPKPSVSGTAAAACLTAAALAVFTVYDIEPAEAAFISADAVYTAEIASVEVEDAAYSETEICDAPDSGKIAAEDAPAASAEADTIYEASEAIKTKMYLIATADGTAIREYSENYSLYYFGYDDQKTGKAATILVDMNEYAPVDYTKYGLTVSEDKGYFLYNGIPVGGFESSNFSFVDGNAVQDGGIFLISKDKYDGSLDETAENDMVQVDTKQFCDITGARL